MVRDGGILFKFPEKLGYNCLNPVAKSLIFSASLTLRRVIVVNDRLGANKIGSIYRLVPEFGCEVEPIPFFL